MATMIYAHLLYLSLFLLSTRLIAEESFLCTSSKQQENMVHDQQLTIHRDQLIKLANDYLLFISDVGSPQSVRSDDPRLEELFAENLTKIDNTSVLFEKNRNALLPQMRSFEVAREYEANTQIWTIDVHNARVIPSAETNSVVINFEWVHIHAGKGTTTVILQRNTNGKIEQIKDVWALVQNK